MTIEYEIEVLKENIEIKKKLGKDSKFEEGILKSYKRWLASRQEHTPATLQSTSDSVK